MPKGPRGFPRLTSLGPFVSVEGEQEYKVEQWTGVRPPGNNIWDILNEMGKLQSEKAESYHSQLIFRAELPESNDVMSRINREIGVVTRERNVGSASWAEYHPEKIGIVGSVDVREGFRKEGIGTELKKRMMDHMRDNGIIEAYTIIISDAGESLARRTGFIRNETTRKMDQMAYGHIPEWQEQPSEFIMMWEA